ncbi:MAG: DUF1275 domain-containing protein [Leptospiraceae bacterium]|nr:DUF1275 domain-containing protein [Leptospiraceae bacterium]MCB1303106.1 DUF1275 domain-containing protein [Leptospiraceae bacterium]
MLLLSPNPPKPIGPALKAFLHWLMVNRWKYYPAALLGAVFLAGIAGAVNLVGLLSVSRAATSHMTGTVTTLSIAIADATFSEVQRLSILLLAFCSGATVSGFATGSSRLDFRKRYGFLMLIEGALLLIGEQFYATARPVYAEWFTAIACGLQNGMVTTISGAIVRTTHLTGIVTDLGVQFGRILRGEEWQLRRMLLHAGIFLGFLAGGILGALAYPDYGPRILIPVSVLLLCVGCSYFLLRSYFIGRLSRRPG